MSWATTTKHRPFHRERMADDDAYRGNPELADDVRRIKEKAEREGSESLTTEEAGKLGAAGVELDEEEKSTD